MNVLVSGASGFIGSNLAKYLSMQGDSVKSLSTGDYELPEAEFAAKTDGAEVIINLSGAPVNARWSENYKKLIYSSRVDTTAKIVRAINASARRPKLFINASAVGIYAPGGTHDEYKFEYGGGFLASVCRDWEAEAAKARAAGVRTVIFRFGLVLDKKGGVLNKMLIPFSMGLGGKIGGGGQYMSWIALGDLMRAFRFVINDEKLEGVFNLSSPAPVTNAEFTAELAAALNRPAFFRVPEFMLKLIFAGGAEIMCEGSAVYPKRLLDAGFKFECPRLKDALIHIINGPA